jgi:oleandomycin transport system ATP-binding protein
MLLRADTGTALINGFDVRTQADKVRENIGLTGQFTSVDEDLTGMQNLVMIGQLLELSKKAARARAAELLEWFDLSEAAGKVAKNYSGGMRRRLDLAASLVGRPSVIFLDEPNTDWTRPSARTCGTWSAAWSATVLPCCSPRSTWRRPTCWPTRSP